MRTRGLLKVDMVVTVRAQGRDRVVAAGVEGVAAPEAANGEPTAAQCAEAGHGFQRVLRARGMEAAGGAYQRAERELVEADRAADQAPHHGVVSAILRQSAARLSCSVRAGTSRAFGRTLTTRSSAGSAR